jgi:hypothetical protein
VRGRCAAASTPASLALVGQGSPRAAPRLLQGQGGGHRSHGLPGRLSADDAEGNMPRPLRSTRGTVRGLLPGLPAAAQF